MNSTSSESHLHNVGEASVLFVMASFGCLGNLAAIVAILVVSKFRKSSTSFLCHHCFLDFIKSMYSFLYGYHFLHGKEVPLCNAVGSSYVFFVTMSAYNLLALMVSEEYNLYSPVKKLPLNNHCCVIFGIFIIWFMCLLMIMGVAFLPKEPQFIPEIGNCIFVYGVPSNFVLHILWMILVSLAIFLAFIHFVSMYIRVRYRSTSVKWAFIHRSLLREMHSIDSQEDVDMAMFQQASYRSQICVHLYLRRVTIFLLMVSSFILFWYPLYLLTLSDYRFNQPIQAYKTLTILSWCHPATTPIFAFLILHDISQKHGIFRRIFSNIYPMMQLFGNQDVQSGNAIHPWETLDSGFYNNYFGHQEMDGAVSREQDRAALLPMVTVCDNQAESEATTESEVRIETYDRSPTSPGKRRRNSLCI